MQTAPVSPRPTTKAVIDGEYPARQRARREVLRRAVDAAQRRQITRDARAGRAHHRVAPLTVDNRHLDRCRHADLAHRRCGETHGVTRIRVIADVPRTYG